MTVVYSPGRPHECNIGWQLVDGSFRDAHHADPPGTVRQCPACARCWIAVSYPDRIGGQASVGVTWRLERPRERRRRGRAQRRRARGIVPPSTALIDPPAPQAAPVVYGVRPSVHRRPS